MVFVIFQNPKFSNILFILISNTSDQIWKHNCGHRDVDCDHYDIMEYWNHNIKIGVRGAHCHITLTIFVLERKSVQAGVVAQQRSKRMGFKTIHFECCPLPTILPITVLCTKSCKCFWAPRTPNFKMLPHRGCSSLIWYRRRKLPYSSEHFTKTIMENIEVETE